MAKYVKKPVEIEAVTFAEFVEYGRAAGGNIVKDMPWSFVYNGHAVTHENDKCYLVPTLEGSMRFTPADMLITGEKGDISICNKEFFDSTYSDACESCGGAVGDDTPLYEDADICRKCHNELLLARASGALLKAKEVIKAWHGDVAWDIYDVASPEMKNINGALKALGA